MIRSNWLAKIRLLSTRNSSMHFTYVAWVRVPKCGCQIQSHPSKSCFQVLTTLYFDVAAGPIRTQEPEKLQGPATDTFHSAPLSLLHRSTIGRAILSCIGDPDRFHCYFWGSHCCINRAQYPSRRLSFFDEKVSRMAAKKEKSEAEKKEGKLKRHREKKAARRVFCMLDKWKQGVP